MVTSGEHAVLRCGQLITMAQESNQLANCKIATGNAILSIKVMPNAKIRTWLVLQGLKQLSVYCCSLVKGIAGKIIMMPNRLGITVLKNFRSNTKLGGKL